MDNGACSYRRYLEGDDNGLRELIDTYYDGLALYLNAFLNDGNDAEEAAEQTFVTLATKKPAFKERALFKTFLYAIGRHTALDLIRRKAAKRTEPLDPAVGSDEEDPAELFLREEKKKTLYRCMRKLKPEHRQVIWLFYFEEMSHQEAAAVMGKSENAADHLLRRARAALKQEMQKEGYTP